MVSVPTDPREPHSRQRRELILTAVRALLLGLVCTIAVSIASALRAPASTPEGFRDVLAWSARVPEGWPASPWTSARYGSQLGRETWERRGDPPMTPTGRANDFAAEWSVRCGWPFHAFVATRHRHRALWGQGVTYTAPWDGRSTSPTEGVVVLGPTLGATEGQFVIPVVPLWGGLIADTILWAIPLFLISALSRRVSLARRDRSTP